MNLFGFNLQSSNYVQFHVLGPLVVERSSCVRGKQLLAHILTGTFDINKKFPLKLGG